MKKYELTDETIKLSGNRVLHRIVALRDFSNVKKGNKGGWIEKEENLSHEGNCWVFDNAWAFSSAEVGGNAKVGGYAIVMDNAIVGGNAQVGGNAKIRSDAKITNNKDYMVFKNWWSSGRYFTWTRSNDKWTVGCFYGTGEELINKAYADSEDKGKHYEEIVEYVNKCVLGKEKFNTNKTNI